MGIERTSSQKPETWIAYLDGDLRCLENSTASKTAWLRCLGLGCLNKSVGDKQHVYSHIRALSSKLHEALSGVKPPTEVDTTRTETRHTERESEYRVHAEDLKKPVTSVIILEDFSKPPLDTEEITPLLFTSTEFFRYVYSNNWGGNISLRVISGEVLNLLLAALYVLERNRLLNSHVIHSNLNNRLKSNIAEKYGPSKAAEESSAKIGSASRILEFLPKPYQHNTEFMYEKMNVEIVFYEKCEASNIPYVIPDTDNNVDQVIKQPIPREVRRGPIALKEHKMNSVRLPPSEDTDTRERIEKLEAELEVLKKGELADTDHLVQTPLIDKSMTGSEKVEWIAEDPYLQTRKSIIPGENQINIKQVVAPIGKETHKQKISSKKSSQDSIKVSEIGPSSTAMEIKDSGQPSARLIGDTISPSTSSGGSYVVIKSPSEFLSEEEEEPVFKRLNLTRNELYITGLYSPRNENKISTQKRLHHIKQIKMKQRNEREKSIYEKLHEKAQCDISERFKCLAAAKEAARRKVTAPKIQKEEHRLKVSRKTPRSSWDKYTKDQEEVEMDSALINNLERGILERMDARAQTKTEEKVKETEQENKTKPSKNRSKNNPHDFDISSLSSGSTFKQCGENSNTNATNKVIFQCPQVGKSNTKLKLPVIQNVIAYSGRKSEHKNQHSITLPHLLKRKNHITTCKNAAKDQLRYQMLKKVLHKDEVAEDNEENIAKITTETNKCSSESADIFENRNDNVFQETFYSPETLHTTHIEEQTLCNINQNQSFIVEYGDDKTLELANGKRSEETSHRPSIAYDSAAQNITSTASDSYTHRLRQYSCECTCYECEDMPEKSSLDKEDILFPDYPPFLGRLRRDFKFLKCRNYKPKATCNTSCGTSDIPEVNHQVACDNILRILDTMMLRKEILTSSLGYTYITITITKPKVTKADTSFYEPTKETTA